ncbi:unnamed protein product [Didymodactylos carnosus]|uniref:Uncharacterized protein n=1 Tax=Didymodactylos carnosus TaxID=1234261 RepID=A0A814YVI3_9BILA|nr:unnamed protein product [Didymodactylos carnosus]CAF3996788.1 unnamed protein product [Didymodactylos carnosus]
MIRSWGNDRPSVPSAVLLPQANIESIEYPVESQAAVQFFAIREFEEKFQNYLKEIFNTENKIEKQFVSDKCKIIIKIRDGADDVASARFVMNDLSSALKFRRFDEPTIRKIPV